MSRSERGWETWMRLPGPGKASAVMRGREALLRERRRVTQRLALAVVSSARGTDRQHHLGKKATRTKGFRRAAMLPICEALWKDTASLLSFGRPEKTSSPPLLPTL